jgi:glutathione synthase/RimK-type ligase-like ATP-grasp enzyme
MTDVALVTYQQLPDLNPDDHPLRDALTALGAATHAVRWDDSGVDWRRFDAVVLRSCWDYHLHLAEFRAWLGAIERSGARLWNPVAVVRWNLDKTYLRDLQAAGIPVPDTVWLEAGAAPDLGGLLDTRPWARAVVKPRVSLSAHDTWVTDAARAADDQARFAALVRSRGALVQEFMPEVTVDGELSMMHVAGAFTHAVRKRAGPDDFRVQRQYGGSAEPVAASERALEGARRALAVVPGPWLYARVDGVERDGRFIVTELEVIEPELFLVWSSEAAQRFARAILTHT